MTTARLHQLTVARGKNVCTCGRDWVCEFSAEGRWAALRKLFERDVALYADQWKDSEAEDMQTVLGYMDELEAAEAAEPQQEER